MGVEGGIGIVVLDFYIVAVGIVPCCGYNRAVCYGEGRAVINRDVRTAVRLY